MAVDHLLQEDGFRIELEGSTNHLVLESSTTLDDGGGVTPGGSWLVDINSITDITSIT